MLLRFGDACWGISPQDQITIAMALENLAALCGGNAYLLSDLSTWLRIVVRDSELMSCLKFGYLGKKQLKRAQYHMGVHRYM